MRHAGAISYGQGGGRRDHACGRQRGHDHHCGSRLERAGSDLGVAQQHEHTGVKEAVVVAFIGVGPWRAWVTGVALVMSRHRGCCWIHVSAAPLLLLRAEAAGSAHRRHPSPQSTATALDGGGARSFQSMVANTVLVGSPRDSHILHVSIRGSRPRCLLAGSTLARHPGKEPCRALHRQDLCADDYISQLPRRRRILRAAAEWRSQSPKSLSVAGPVGAFATASASAATATTCRRVRPLAGARGGVHRLRRDAHRLPKPRPLATSSP